MFAFEAGKTYEGRSVCDSELRIVVSVAKRTAKTITTIDGKTMRVAEHGGSEYVMPWGRYSMAPCVRAERIAG